MHAVDVQCNPKIKNQIDSMIHEHIDAVVHHTVSMAAIIAMLSGKKKVDVSHLQGVKTYIASKCERRKVSGGFMPSDFYGYPHPAYSSSNANAGVQASTIQWDKQVARPAQGPAQSQSGGGGGNEMPKLIKAVLKDMNVSASRAALVELEEIIQGHIHCFLRDVRDVAPVTVKKLEKVLRKSAHAAFH